MKQKQTDKDRIHELEQEVYYWRRLAEAHIALNKQFEAGLVRIRDLIQKMMEPDT